MTLKKEDKNNSTQKTILSKIKFSMKSEYNRRKRSPNTIRISENSHLVTTMGIEQRGMVPKQYSKNQQRFPGLEIKLDEIEQTLFVTNDNKMFYSGYECDEVNKEIERVVETMIDTSIKNSLIHSDRIIWARIK